MPQRMQRDATPLLWTQAPSRSTTPCRGVLKTSHHLRLSNLHLRKREPHLPMTMVIVRRTMVEGLGNGGNRFEERSGVCVCERKR